ncbi:hypothetical protein [Bdellovibrio sp. HCB274]|uniref:hypothetical protein n=1 Tax=Bdellovibrio sp. HCB274 TaxID=3394361 RepID=UPI0039B45C53
MKKPVLLIAISALLLLFTTACQEGVKKTEDVQIHTLGVSELEQISSDLNTHGIDLKKEAPVLLSKEPLAEIRDLEIVQVLLEKYALKATKLLELGDTKVVLFPEKEKIFNYRKKVYRYLGDVYARQIANSVALAVENREVGYAEMETRHRIFTRMIITYIDSGVSLDSIQKGTYGEVIKTMSSDSLKACIASSKDTLGNSTRIVELGVKYDGFDIPNFNEAFESLPTVAYVFASIEKLMSEELKLRELKQ